VVEYLLNKRKALGSISSTAKGGGEERRKGERGKRREEGNKGREGGRKGARDGREGGREEVRKKVAASQQVPHNQYPETDKQKKMVYLSKIDETINLTH
jgi:hypothetical protein